MSGIYTIVVCDDGPREKKDIEIAGYTFELVREFPHRQGFDVVLWAQNFECDTEKEAKVLCIRATHSVPEVALFRIEMVGAVFVMVNPLGGKDMKWLPSMLINEGKGKGLVRKLPRSKLPEPDVIYKKFKQWGII